MRLRLSTVSGPPLVRAKLCRHVSADLFRTYRFSGMARGASSGLQSGAADNPESELLKRPDRYLDAFEL